MKVGYRVGIGYASSPFTASLTFLIAEAKYSVLSSMAYLIVIVQVTTAIVKIETDDAIIFPDPNPFIMDIKTIKTKTICKNVFNKYSYKNLAQWLS